MRSLVLLAMMVPASWSFFTAESLARTPTCDALTGEAKNIALYILSTEHPYDCCDGTIAECVKERPDCPLAVRLANFVCRRAAGGQDKDTIKRSLQRRALSMIRPGRTFEIDLEHNPLVGCSRAKVQAVAYTCARCPYCSRLLPAIYREVTSGQLAGKVALHFKLFPIKSHDHSAESNLALAAAGSLGKSWEYLLKIYSHFDSFDTDRLTAWAGEVGLDTGLFDEASRSGEVRKALVTSKKEGLRNKVVATPTFFINGRKYQGDLDIDTLVDVLEEEAEAVR